MARFLIGTIPVVGHVGPAVPIARRLVERGHEVWWYTGQLFQPTVEATGAKFVPMVNALDYSIAANVPTAWIEQRNSRRGVAQLKFDLKHFFIDAAAGHVQDYRALLPEFPADVLISDSFFLGAAWVHEQTGLPWAQFGISALAISSRDTAPFGLGLPPSASWLGQLRNTSLHWLFQQVLLRDVLTYTNSIRTSLGLPPTDQSFFDVVSPFLYLVGTVPSFEYPRHDLPAQIHFIGPFLPDPPSEFTPPIWWADLQTEQPVVHVTQGTVATEAEDLIVPTLQALASEPVLVVATTGGKPADALKLDPVPANVRIESFIPYYHLLPQVDVMITNGGYNGVQMALAHGIPLVTAGKTEDKAEVSARVAWSGVGLDLKTKTPTPEQIKAAVQKLLNEPHYKANAAAIQAEIRRSDTPNRAVELLEQLADTKQPILRTV